MNIRWSTALAVLAVLSLLTPSSARAAAFDLESIGINADFEDPNLGGDTAAEQYSTNNIGPGWTREILSGTSGNFGVQDPPTGFYAGSHPLPGPFEGNQFGFVNIDSGTSQIVSSSIGLLQANTTYMLDVAVGARNNSTFANGIYDIGLRAADGTELGTFASTTLDPASGPTVIQNLHYVLDTGLDATAIGQNVSIVIRGTNTGIGGSFFQMNFDNVRLDIDPLPPPPDPDPRPDLGTIDLVSLGINGNFEAPNLGGNNASEQFSNSDIGPGWTREVLSGAAANFGVQDPPTGFYAGSHPLPGPFEGNQFGFVNLNGGGDAAQIVSDAVSQLKANRIYTLNVAVGARNNSGWANGTYEIGLRAADGTDLGTFASTTLDPASGPTVIEDLQYVLNTNLDPAGIGQDYSIVIRGTNTGIGGGFFQMNVDNVRLVVSVPEPASGALCVAGVVGLAVAWRTRKRRVP